MRRKMLESLQIPKERQPNLPLQKHVSKNICLFSINYYSFIYYSEKEVRQVFRKLDKDGNGFISPAELKHEMMATLDKKIDSMIKEADVDGDGQINFLEFDKVNSGPSNLCCSTIVPPFKNKPEEEVLAPPKPPDGGWGWVIVFSCFMCNFIVGKNNLTTFLVT